MSDQAEHRDFDERDNERQLSEAWDDWAVTNIGDNDPWTVTLTTRRYVYGSSRAGALRRAVLLTRKLKDSP